MVPSSRLRPRSAPASASLSTNTALPPADAISSPCTPTPSSHTECSSVGSTSRRGRGRGSTKGFCSERTRAKTGGKLLVLFKNNVPIGINASDFVSEIGLQVRNITPVRGVQRWKEVPADARQVIKARVFERSMKNTESRKRLPYNHCMGFKSFTAAMLALEDPETGEEPHIIEFFKASHYNEKKKQWTDPKCQEIHEKLVAEREKCTEEGAIQLTQEQISINVLGGRSRYLRGFGNVPKPTCTTRSTRTDSANDERGALRATVKRLQNENVVRSQEMEHMKNNQVAMQRQMEEMVRLVARVTGSDMMTQGGVLNS